MAQENPTIELYQKWVEMLMSTLEILVDEGTRAGLMESCGRVCALHHGSIEQAIAIKHSAKEIDEVQT